MTDYEGTTSNSTVALNVTEAPLATTLTIELTPTDVFTDVAAFISGLLTAADGAVPSQTIQLQLEQTDGTFADVDGMTATTDATGAYSMSVSESAVGTYVFQTVYAGGSV